MDDAQRRGDALAEWSRLHGGYDVQRSRTVRAWLSVAMMLAAPLIRLRVAPLVVTLSAVPAAAGACLLAPGGTAARAGAAALVLLAAVLDGVDGAVAIGLRRVTAFGYVADSVVDRVTDGLFLIALWRAGGPGWLAVLAGAAVLLLEYARARAAAAGLAGIGTVTVGERPMRVVVAVVALAACAAAGSHAPAAAEAGLVATLGLAVVGLGQFLAVAGSALREG